MPTAPQPTSASSRSSPIKRKPSRKPVSIWRRKRLKPAPGPSPARSRRLATATMSPFLKTDGLAPSPIRALGSGSTTWSRETRRTWSCESPRRNPDRIGDRHYESFSKDGRFGAFTYQGARVGLHDLVTGDQKNLVVRKSPEESRSDWRPPL